MSHSSALPHGDVAFSQRERGRSDLLFRIRGAAVMLFPATEATDALLAEHRLPAPPPSLGDEALAALRGIDATSSSDLEGALSCRPWRRRPWIPSWRSTGGRGPRGLGG